MSNIYRDTIKVIFIPGNQGGTPFDGFFPWLGQRLDEGHGFEVIGHSFPDSYKARAKYWLPHIEKIGADENTVLVGWSSGVVAAMRFAEKHKIRGSIFIGAYYTDHNIELERESGYFDTNWDWEAIKNNQDFIGIFNSEDDPHLDMGEAEDMAKKLGADLVRFTDRGHFRLEDNPKNKEVPEILEYIITKTQNA